MPFSNGVTNRFLAVDVDADQDLDMVLANGRAGVLNQPDDLYVNDGTGRFFSAPSTFPPNNEATSDVAAGDLDGDGDQDLVAANAHATPSPSNYLWLNDGRGKFLDVLLVNDGLANFTDASACGSYGSVYSGSIAVRDFDADGDADIVIPLGLQSPGNATVLTSLRRHQCGPASRQGGPSGCASALFSPGMPVAPRIGFVAAACPRGSDQSPRYARPSPRHPSLASRRPRPDSMHDRKHTAFHALLLVLVLVEIPRPLTGQGERGRTLEGTLRYYERLKDADDAARARAVRQLGAYDDPRVTAILLDEIARAKAPALVRAVVRALGQKPRNGAVAALAPVLDRASDDFELRNAAARALAAQGDAGVEALTARLAALPAGKLDPAQRSLRRSLLEGLGSASGSVKAQEALAAAARAGDELDRLDALQELREAPPSDPVTAARTAAKDARSPLLAAEGLRQLARHGAAVKDAILALHKSTRGNDSGRVHAALLEALACVLGPDTFAAFLEHAAFVDAEIEEGLPALAERLRDDAELAAFLLAHGIGHKGARERAASIRLLAKMPGDAVAKALTEAARAKEPQVAGAAVRALAERGEASAVPVLEALAQGGAAPVRAEALRALHRLRHDDPAWRQALLERLREQQGELRLLALDLLADLGAEEALPEAWKDLEADAWPARAAAYDYCRKVRAKASVERLIARVDAEHGRLREDVLDALEALTGRRLTTGERWREWWREAGERFELVAAAEEGDARPRPGARPQTAARYFDIPVTSARCCFVVDISGSMTVPFGSDGRTRLAEAQRQLRAVLEALPQETRFNLLAFETRVTATFKSLTVASGKAREQARKAVDALQARGGTNIHDALEQAFTDPDLDTIYLLTDGYPSAGRIEDPEALAAEVARWNSARRIRIHTIAIGSRSPLLERLARDSGGTHAWVR